MHFNFFRFSGITAPRISDLSSKRVLVYCQFAVVMGGGEFFPLLLINELKAHHCVVTLAVYGTMESIEQAKRFYQIGCDLQNVEIQSVRPKNGFIRRLDSILPFYRCLRLKKMARKADICISTANLIDFGKKSYQFLIDIQHFSENAFYDFFLPKDQPTGLRLVKRHIRMLIIDFFFRPILGIRSTQKILADRTEHIFVPSQYVADTMRSFYGPFNCTVFYPPTIFEFPSIAVTRYPMRILYLGRISESKLIIKIIEIIDRAREITGMPLELHIVGFMSSVYAKKILRLAAQKKWIQCLGALFGLEKARILLSGTYAIHAERDEAFGISITEYLKAGCIPIVPNEGGTAEIVANPQLTYHTDEDAAKILVHLLTDDMFRLEQLTRCKERAKDFSAERYMESQHRILNSVLGEQT